MTLCVNAEPLPAGEGLRRLVLGALPGLVGNGRVVAESLSLPGEPILALDGGGAPVLISFTGADGPRALADGLEAASALRDNGAFWLPLCPALEGIDNLDRLQLLTLVPGDARFAYLLGSDVRVMTIRAVRVNGELALLTEAAASEPAPTVFGVENGVEMGAANESASRFRPGDAALTGTETAFFDQL